MHIPDIRFKILCHLHINDIKNICFTDKLSLDICSDKNFWINKFKNDKMLLLNTNNLTINDWISTYDKIYEAQENARKIMIINTIEYFEDQKFGRILLWTKNPSSTVHLMSEINKTFETFSVINSNIRMISLNMVISSHENYDLQCDIYENTINYDEHGNNIKRSKFLSSCSNKQILDILTICSYYEIFICDECCQEFTIKYTSEKFTMGLGHHDDKHNRRTINAVLNYVTSNIHNLQNHNEKTKLIETIYMNVLNEYESPKIIWFYDEYSRDEIVNTLTNSVYENETLLVKADLTKIIIAKVLKYLNII